MRRALDRLLVAAFLASLGGPFVDQLFRPASARDTKVEFRAPSPLPKRPDTLEKMEDWPAAYEAWYLDHFGLRDRLLRWNGILRWFVIGVSPTRKFVRGADDWIFQTDFRALDDHRGAHPLSHGELDAWRRYLEGRRDALRAKGIEYVMAIAPHKSCLYPELVPDRFEVRGPTRAEELESYLERTSDVRILDARSALRAAKAEDPPEDPLYFPLGTHWTGSGERVGYRVVAQEIERRVPSFRPLADDAYAVAPIAGQGDTWAGRMYLEGLLPQRATACKLRAPRARHLSDPTSNLPFTAEIDDASLPRVLFFHDSYGVPLRPLLAESCSRLVAVWSGDLDWKLVEKEKPDVVVQLLTEQNFQRTIPQAYAEEDGGARERRFQASDRVLWRFDPRRFPEGLVADGKSRMRLEDGAILFERRAGADTLLLPELSVPRGEDLLVRIELERAHDGEPRIFYATRQEREYGPDRSVGCKSVAGRGAIVHEIPEDDFAGRLAWSAGGDLEPIRIRSIEIRTAAPVR